MSEVWPLDVKQRLTGTDTNAIRPFKCLLLMPFDSRFNQVAQIIEATVREAILPFERDFGMAQPVVKRLDWVVSAQVIQQEIWREIIEADLVFCDITGHNPNVMFECGVCAAWKKMGQVVFVKDAFFKQQSAFDIAPVRYTEYELTSDGCVSFRKKVVGLTRDALVAFPDSKGGHPELQLPLEIGFRDHRDDARIVTPPFAHRRVVDGALEFGSIFFFEHSWATIGRERFLNFSLEFLARFSNPRDEAAYIGVGLRSQHFYANFGHILYVNPNGSITITEPNEQPPQFYQDRPLREPTSFDAAAYHRFRVTFNESVLRVEVDEFAHEFEVARMEKVFGPGFIRFQACRTWMAIRELKVLDADL